VYKHLASVQPAAQIPSIGISLLQETVMKFEHNFVNGKSMKLQDIDRIAIKLNSQSQVFHPIAGNPPAINPEKHLIRYQFMEFLVRIA
jgi:hypothetical protein